VFGGHVVEGCIVRTTAEIVLGVVAEGLTFRRAHDERSGYAELFVLEHVAPR
jgi:predicted DNA-binding protein with PD1-like motif